MNLKSVAPKSENGPAERERFSSYLMALGIFAGFILLLVILFPKQRLMDMIVSSDGDNAATVGYLEAMLRVRPADANLRLKYAGVLLRDGKPLSVLHVLEGMPSGFSGEDRRTSLELRRRALSGFLAAPPRDSKDKEIYRKQLQTVNRELGILPPAALPADAGGDDAYRKALACGDYRAAASVCFEAMGKVDDLKEKRLLFIHGVSALQRGDLPVEAFTAGLANLDSLYNDRPALEFLARAGLAAGRPERAQVLMKRALGMKRIIQRTEAF